MSVSNGQPANQTTFNTALMSRTNDTNTVGKVDLEESSTTDLIDVQRVINEELDANGVANQAATDANAKVYSSTNVVANGDDRKVAIGKLDAEFDTSSGHTHNGSDSAEIVDAGLAQNGQVTTSAQSFAGVKEFAARPTTNSIDILDISSAQVITSKDFDGGTASNTSRMTVPKDTTANLASLTDKQATIAWDTTLGELVGDNGSGFNAIGGGGSTVEILYINETQATSVNGGTNSTGAYTTRILNTSSGDTGFLVSLSSNQFELDAGDYYIWWSSPFTGVNNFKTRLRNTTGGSDIIIGSVGNTARSGIIGANIGDSSIGMGKFTIAAAQDLEIQYFTAFSQTNTGLGFAYAAPGDSEIYTQIQIISIT